MTAPIQVAHPAALTPHQACNYIGIDSENDALKHSRSTGILWGVRAPKFIKAGSKKILYMVEDLDEFLAQFKSFTNTAQASMDVGGERKKRG